MWSQLSSMLWNPQCYVTIVTGLMLLLLSLFCGHCSHCHMWSGFCWTRQMSCLMVVKETKVRGGHISLGCNITFTFFIEPLAQRWVKFYLLIGFCSWAGKIYSYCLLTPCTRIIKDIFPKTQHNKESSSDQYRWY